MWPHALQKEEIGKRKKKGHEWLSLVQKKSESPSDRERWTKTPFVQLWAVHAVHAIPSFSEGLFRRGHPYCCRGERSHRAEKSYVLYEGARPSGFELAGDFSAVPRSSAGGKCQKFHRLRPISNL
jgi:hypothetical protein